MPNKPGKNASAKSIIGLISGALLAFGIVWISAQLFGEELARKHVKIHSQALQQQVVQSLVRGSDVFVDRRTETTDQALMQRLVRNSDINSITFFSHDGRAFWSTIISHKKSRLTPYALRNLLASKAPMISAEPVNLFTLDQMMRRLQLGWFDSPTKRHLVTVITPVVREGQIIGAIEFSVDNTNALVFFAKGMNLAALFIGSFLAAIYFIAGCLAIRYALARHESTTATIAVREAKKSEFEAREKADQLVERNEFVGQLNRLLEVNLKQLNEAQEALVRKSRLAQMGELTATVAHEIRNPLGALHNALFMIGKLSDQSDTMNRHLALAERSISRCDLIITELLDFTRDDQLKRVTLKFDDWVLATVRKQAKTLSPAVGIECQLSARDVEASFDPERMQRVLTSMLSNASEALVNNDGKPRNQDNQDPLIKILSRKTARGVEFTVRDNGQGMDETQLAKIFEPLYSTKNFGVGLGVPAAQQILQHHGGGLEYQSEVGKGTSATAWFPLQHREMEPVMQSSVPEKFTAPRFAESI